MTEVPTTAVGERPADPGVQAAWPWYAAVRFLAALVLFAAGGLVYRAVSSAPAPTVPVVAGWTVGVAVVLWWWRAQLDRFANLLRFGRQATGYEAVRALLQRMSTSLPIDDVVPQLAESVGRSTQSTRTEVRINLDDGGQSLQVWPLAAAGAGPPLTAQIRHLGDAVGTLELYSPGPDADRRRRLLAEVTGPAGVAMSAVRLTWNLRRRVAELGVVNEQIQASQRRLITARLDAQVGMQTDVEQQVLVHLSAAEEQLAVAGPDLSAVAITAAAGELTAALDRLRSIARGIYPPRLGEAGLAVSLNSWREGLQVPVSIQVSDAAEVAHHHPDIETCLYFVLVETGAWAIRSGCTALAIEVVGDADVVRFELVLTAITTWPSPGELAVADRLAAFGGTFETTVGADGSSLRLTGRISLKPAMSPADPDPTTAACEPVGRS